MKILHTDTDDLENPLRGGQPVRTFQINSRLADRHDIVVLTATYPGSQRRQTRSGIKYRRLGFGMPGLGLSHHMSFLASLPYAIRTTEHDLVVEEFTPPVGFCMSPWWTDKPVISIVQWFFFEDWERRYKLPFRKMMRALSRRAQYRHFIVQTERMGDYFRELLPAATIWKVPCGIGDTAFHASDGPGNYALYLGRLDINHKGLDYLISAWRLLAESGLRLPLKIAGAGQGQEWLEQEIRRHRLDDCIELVGRVEGEAKDRLLRDCRYLVMPSRQETFGLTALEAMAAGRPVIAFDIDHLNEVVSSKWGALVELGNVAALASEVAALWGSPERARELGRRGFEEAQKYRWDVLATRQEEIYLDVQRGWRATV